LARLNGERGTAVNSCLEALDGITNVAIAAAFRIHPVVYDDPGNRYSEELRPSDDLIRKWFDQGLSDYQSKVAACEEEFGAKRSSRLLSGDLPKQARYAMAKRCYYEVLEVERSAVDGELKSAFRKLAMKWPPDRNPGDKSSETRFKEINEAYEVLKDADKRAAYDRFGHAAFEHGGARPAGGFRDAAPAFSGIVVDLSRLGGGRRGR